MKVLVTGGREYRNRCEMHEVLSTLHTAHQFTFLIHGDARGADRLAGKWAEANGVQPVAMKALWDLEGDAAGSKRNQRMYEFAKPDLIVAFSGGRGTANMMKTGFTAKHAGDPVDIIDVEDMVL